MKKIKCIGIVFLMSILVLQCFEISPVLAISVQPQIACGYHTVLLKSDGTLWAWGDNFNGQLGNSTTESSTIPLKTDINDVKQISCSSIKTFILKNYGTVLVCDSQNNKTTPAQANITNVNQIDGDDSHIVALKNDGTVWAWGDSYNGRLGRGSMPNPQNDSSNNSIDVSTMPMKGTISDVTQIACGNGYTVALKNDGTLWGWGDNDIGQLGNGKSRQRRVNLTQAIITDIRQIACGVRTTVALKNDGTVWVWGENKYGQFGNGTKEDGTVPVKISITDVKQIACGSGYTVAIKNDGTVWAWGDNRYGQLGNGTTEESTKPVQVNITDVSQIACGDYHTVAMKNDGTVWAWGYNKNGQLGNGATDDSAVPVQSQTKAASNQNIYNTIDPGEKVILPADKLDKVTDQDTATNAVETVAKTLTDEQKQSSTGVDKVTVFTEEAVSQASSKNVSDSNVVVTAGIVKELETKAVDTASSTATKLENNGIKVQRRIIKTVKLKTNENNKVNVSIDKDAFDTSADNIKIDTPFVGVSVNTNTAKNALGDNLNLTIEKQDTNKVSVNFNNNSTTTVKISFPNLKGDTTYMAVKDEEGKNFGGKYNPATKSLEAKIATSGIYSVVDNKKDFEDIQGKTKEMQDAIMTLASKGISLKPLKIPTT